MRSLGQWIIESKVYLLIIHAQTEKKKVQDCDYVFGSSTKLQRRMNAFVKADICRQVSVCLHVFCGILFALKPFCDYSLCSVCILLQPAFYSQSVVCISHSVCILPLVCSLQSTVRSPQSAVRSLHFTLTGCSRVCVSQNLHTACLRFPFIHLGEETKWTNVSCLRKQHDSMA